MVDGDWDARADCLWVVTEGVEGREAASEGEGDAVSHSAICTDAMC